MTYLIPRSIGVALPQKLPQWISATWDDYVRLRDDDLESEARLFFNQGWLWVDMGGEGLNHARINRLLALLFFVWFSQREEQDCDDLGGCILEKTGFQAASPDAVLYIGDPVPRWKTGETRSIDLDQWRVPDLVGEVGDTTIATDLDEKKTLYAALEIPEYWVIDVKALCVLAFRLMPSGRYQQIDQSIALTHLPIALLNQTLEQVNAGMTNNAAAQWFGQQIQGLSASENVSG
jgi:Uma2 family endonuclease